MKRLTPAMIAMALCGCGLMNVPMVVRLDEDNQKLADNSWHEMLTPAERVDRETLLGALMTFQMYQLGVDRADYRSEKKVGEKRIVMEVHFRREKPEEDGFYVTVFGPYGQVLRSERYSREDVESMSRDLYESPPTTRPLTPLEESHNARRETLMLHIQKAVYGEGWTPQTEPATRP